jgi:tetratricopeptide (TPR) repeat protein
LCITFAVAGPSACALALFTSTAVALAQKPPAAEADVPSEMELRELVKQMGDPEFARREEAQRTLEGLGIEAFDILREAKDYPELEISRRARYLLRRLDVIWYEDADSSNVKGILEKYGALSKIDRATRIDALASLPIEEGIPVLCRIARLETDDRLSKRAAVSLIRAKYFGESVELRDKIAKQIEEATSRGRRTSVSWLRTYADSLRDPEANVLRWRKVVAAERKSYANYPATSSNSILLRLLRFQTETLLMFEDRLAAKAAAAEAAELVEGKPHELLTHVDWLLDRSFPELVVEFSAQHSVAFNDGLGLRYRLAEAYRKAGKDDEANQAAKDALVHRNDDYPAHLEVAGQLESRGLHDWAEAEFRFVGDGDDENLVFSYRARVSLGEMLRDQFHVLKAATVLQTVFDEIDNDLQKMGVFRQYRQTENSLRSRMHYFYYLVHKKKGDVERQQMSLEKGFEADPDDVDLLIGMYRFFKQTGDKTYATTVKQRLASSQSRLLMMAQRYDVQVKDPRGAMSANIRLAHYNNQYAWLVANTTGDYDEALRRCRQSVDLMPDASGYWDTLGRCYFAKKEFAAAVKYQKHAASLEPHSGLIRQQLQLFEDALKGSEQNEAGT